jgi:RimJ/RimL family protein N-acetyltransferase
MQVIVRTLSEADRPAVLRHLTRLPPEDRWLRFGRSMDRRALKRYAKNIDFNADRAFGIFDAQNALTGFGHLALDSKARFAELGLSVVPEGRRQGQGEALLRRAALHASNLGIHVIHMYCLKENEGMMRLARKAGFTVITEGFDATGAKQLAAGSLASRGQEALCEQMALVDRMYKRRSQILKRLASLGRMFAEDLKRVMRARRQPQH